MGYFQAGYFLIKVNDFYSGPRKGFSTLTTSSCINQNFRDADCLSWVSVTNELKQNAAEALDITDKKFKQLETWVDEEFNSKRLGWPDLFFSLESLVEYRDKFFEERKDLVAVGLSITESAANEIVEDSKPTRPKQGESGLSQMLKRKIPEDPRGEFVGYDLIQLEYGGGFHSIHCFTTKSECETELGLSFNDYGLFERHSNWAELIEHLDDERNGFRGAGPWRYCRVTKY